MGGGRPRHRSARQLRKPDKLTWAMQKDGDIWSMVWQAILAKTLAAIFISKIKGHATDDDVASNPVTLTDKIGNDGSDAIV